MSIRFIVASFCLAVLAFAPLCASAADAASRWPREKANAWYASRPWPVGCNFAPSTAINELEMWQADTFDPATIDRELGWAQGLGFNSVRVFLHDIPYQEDREGFLKRIDAFLGIADKHHIGAVFVLFDACWDPFPEAGKQRVPKPHLHNSGWVQCPGAGILKDPARHDELKPYVQGVMRRFKDDARVQAWDLFNEPDNINNSSYSKFEPANKQAMALVLLQKEFGWAREINPIQPLTTGVWIGNWGDPDKLSAMEKVQLGQSDIISFHNYAPLPEITKCVEHLRRYHRPILCTEYMARPVGSTFQAVLPYLKEQKVGAYNWGFVSGKTQTIYPWDSWSKQYNAEPTVWFHDIFRTDGRAYDPKEVQLIRHVTGARAQE
ncbi:MAG TPA: hypothetical protein VFC78_09790 [Tepidisphaeraceae bacterium]|nr:hypothetical protein [Tepidisphaeraceae bacterium]